MPRDLDTEIAKIEKEIEEKNKFLESLKCKRRNSSINEPDKNIYTIIDCFKGYITNSLLMNIYGIRLASRFEKENRSILRSNTFMHALELCIIQNIKSTTIGKLYFNQEKQIENTKKVFSASNYLLKDDLEDNYNEVIKEKSKCNENITIYNDLIFQEWIKNKKKKIEEIKNTSKDEQIANIEETLLNCEKNMEYIQTLLKTKHYHLLDTTTNTIKLPEINNIIFQEVEKAIEKTYSDYSFLNNFKSIKKTSTSSFLDTFKWLVDKLTTAPKTSAELLIETMQKNPDIISAKYKNKKIVLPSANIPKTNIGFNLGGYNSEEIEIVRESKTEEIAQSNDENDNLPHNNENDKKTKLLVKFFQKCITEREEKIWNFLDLATTPLSTNHLSPFNFNQPQLSKTYSTSMNDLTTNNNFNLQNICNECDPSSNQDEPSTSKTNTL